MTFSYIIPPNRNGLDVSGKVMINGHIVDQKQMSDNSVFVQQADIFVGTLTVKEHLTFHGKLRMKHSSGEEIKNRVEDVMAQMGLKKCESVLIGVADKIKGGERRTHILTHTQVHPSHI